MIRTHTTPKTRWLAPIAAIAGLALTSGCSTFERIGSSLGITGPSESSLEAATTAATAAPDAPNQPAGYRVVNASQGANQFDEPFVDPFAAGGKAESRSDPRQPKVTPWAATPGASIFGEINDSYMGPTAFGLQHTGADNLDQVSFATEGADFDPDIAPTGDFLVYSSTQHTTTADIYRKSVNGHTITQLTNDAANDVMPAISPDGSRIAFASDRGGTWDIYVMNADGGQAVQLTNDPAPQLHPTWSPDNRFIAFCRLGDTSGRWELWVTDVLNPAVRHFIGYGLLPDWSPAGSKIAFQRSRQRGDRFFSIWTIDFDRTEGRNPTEIVSSPVAACVNPSFSADGSKIAFAVVPNPELQPDGSPRQADLWITNIDGTGRANLTGGLFANLMPTWGVNGRIFFISDRSGSENIWSLRPERAILAATGPNPTSNTDLAKNGSDTATGAELATVPDDNEPN